MNKYIDKPVFVVKTFQDANNFINECKLIYDNKIDEKSFCGIDFEFNMNWNTKKRFIGLMQIII